MYKYSQQILSETRSVKDDNILAKMQVRQAQTATAPGYRPPIYDFLKNRADYRVLRRNSRHDGDLHCPESRCAGVDAYLSRYGRREPYGRLRFPETRGCASGSWYRRYAPCRFAGHIEAIRGYHLKFKIKHSIYGNEYAGSVFFCVLENILLEVRT